MGVPKGPCREETVWPDVNSGMIYQDRIQGPINCTLLQYYAIKHANSASAAEWRRSIVAGTVSLNGRVERDPNATIPPNSVLAYHRPGWTEPPAPAFLDVLWWDADIVAVHKPSGLQVLPAGPFHERCALTLLRQFHERHHTELKGMPAPVHRLGRGTSGVLICCCSDEARRRLSRDFVEHGGINAGCMRKVYRALVAGLVTTDEVDVDVPIGRVDYPGVRGGLYAARPDGGLGAKPSRSHYNVVHRNELEGTTLVDVEIFTGRPHQIRIHMAAAGHPLVGDPLYAPGGLPWPPPTQRQQHQQQAAQPSQGQAVGDSTAVVEDLQVASGPPDSSLTLANGKAAGDASAGTSESSRCVCDECEDAARPLRTVMPGDCGYLLHSMVLEFNHPITGQRVTATCEPPPLLQVPLP